MLILICNFWSLSVANNLLERANFFASRKLYRSIAFYLGTSWVVIEASNYFIHRFNYPDSLRDAFLILLSFGLLSVILFERMYHNDGKIISKILYYCLHGANFIAAFTLAAIVFEADKKSEISHFETSSEKISIAVLPFVDISPGNDNEWLGDGICDQIIDQLNLMQSIDVKSRSASFYFKNKEYGLVEIAEILGVTNILEGTVMKLDTVLRISVKLVDPTTGSQIWHQSFEKSFNDIFSIQSEIALSVANKIEAEISSTEEESLTSSPTKNTKAYEAFLKGKYHYNFLTPADNKRAHDYFETAIRLDSTLSVAYVYLGFTYNMFGGQWLELTPDEAYKKTRALATKALLINPELPIAEFLLANVYYFYDREHKKGLELAATAFINANNKEDMLWLYSAMLCMNKQADIAIGLLKNYIESNQTSAPAYQALGNAYIVNGEFKKVIKPCLKPLELNPQQLYSRYYIAEAYFAMQEYETSIKHWATLYKNVPAPVFLEGLIRSNFYAGNNEEAQQLFESLVKQSKTMPMHYILAKAYATFGNVDLAIENLEKAYSTRDVEMTAIWIEPALDPIRNEPRFKEILERFNFKD